MQKGLSIFVSIFCGVLIGASLGSAVELLPQGSYYGAAVGGFIGALLAYMMDDFKTTRVAATRAWLATKAQSALEWQWHPNHDYWRLVRLYDLAGLAVLANIVYTIPMALVARWILQHIGSWHLGTIDVWLVSGLLALLEGIGIVGTLVAVVFPIVLAIMVPPMAMRWGMSPAEYDTHLSAGLKGASEIREMGNPIAVLRYTRDAVLPTILRGAGALARDFAYFLGYVIALIHSQSRIICMVHTALFVGVAKLLGFTLWGDLAAAALGGMMGVASYYFIGIKGLEVARFARR